MYSWAKKLLPKIHISVGVSRLFSDEIFDYETRCGLPVDYYNCTGRIYTSNRMSEITCLDCLENQHRINLDAAEETRKQLKKLTVLL